MKPEVLEFSIVGDNPPKSNLYYGQNVIQTLRELPADSVHSVMTSPPYWGLRSYGTEPQVWGGDPDCDHEWKEHKQYKDSPVRKGNEGVGFHDTATTKSQRWVTSNFCFKCHAWRGELGHEPEISLYVQHLVEIFREVKRVLHPSGTLWLNLGDSFMSQPPGSQESLARMGSSFQGKRLRDKQHYQNAMDGVNTRRQFTNGLKPKDLVGMPWRVALALQEDGWWLRRDILWRKNNPFPESCRDRCTTAHEYIFMLTKRPDYFYDAEAIKEPLAESNSQRTTNTFNTRGRGPKDNGNSGLNDLALRMRSGEHHKRNKRSVWDADESFATPASGVTYLVIGDQRIPLKSGDFILRSKEIPPNLYEFFTEIDPQNASSIFQVNTRSYKGAHFAVWPVALVEPMVKAGTSQKGCCPHCLAPWKRVVARRGDQKKSEAAIGGCPDRYDGGFRTKDTTGRGGNVLATVRKGTDQWQPTCKCPEHEPVKCVVMDIFSGSGTTGFVANGLGRDYIGIDLNPKYLPLAKARILGMDPPKTEEPQSESILDLLCK